MPHAHRRHDISDKVWSLLEPHLPGRTGAWGGIAKDSRYLSMPCFGLCARVHHDGTCRMIMGTGATPIAVSSAGETKVCGSGYWTF